MLRSIHGFSTCSRFHTVSKSLQAHFDTNKFNTMLIKEGFSEQQAHAVIKIVQSSLNEGIESVTKNLVSKEQLTKLAYQQKVDFAKLKGQLQSTDRGEFNHIQNEHERIKNDLDKMRTRLREEITKANAGFKLDLSLEKGRIREEGSIHDLQIKEIDTRIDQEVSNMKMQIDGVKTQVMQWLIGVCTGTFALVLAYVRLLS